MAYSTPEQRSFHPMAGHTVRADCAAGALSADFGVLLLRGMDRQIGLTARLAAAIRDTRHPSDLAHPLRALLAQRISQSASGDADGHDANGLRREPLRKLGGERRPLAPAQDLARAPTVSRLAHRVDRQDLYRLPQALAAHFGSSDPEPPAALGLDLDHTDDLPHGQPECAFYHPYSKNECYLPRLSFEGLSGALVPACLRPGPRPTGAANAMSLGRLLAFVRRHGPQPPILVRGDSPCATPEVIEVLAPRPGIDGVFGLAGHPVLRRHAAPVMQEARRLHQQRTALAQAHHTRPRDSSRLSTEFAYGAASWAQPWRGIRKAEGMASGDHPRFVVTSLAAPTPQRVYEALYGARGTCEHHSQAIKCDLHSDRTAATTFRANAMRLLLTCAADVLPHALRTPTLPPTALAQAPPSTVILTLFQVTPQVKQYKDRLLRHLPSSCPITALRHRVTTWLSLVPLPGINTS